MMNGAGGAGFVNDGYRFASPHPARRRYGSLRLIRCGLYLLKVATKGVQSLPFLLDYMTCEIPADEGWAPEDTSPAKRGARLELGPFTPQQRTSSDCIGASGSCQVPNAGNLSVQIPVRVICTRIGLL